jgi:hypothetical protein
MRKFFLLLLVASFSMYASATVTYPSISLPEGFSKANTETIDVKQAKKIDFETFKDLVAKNGISKIELSVYGSFWYTDSCGGTYYVEYWGMSFGEALMFLYDQDDLFCTFPGRDWIFEFN